MPMWQLPSGQKCGVGGGGTAWSVLLWPARPPPHPRQSAQRKELAVSLLCFLSTQLHLQGLLHLPTSTSTAAHLQLHKQGLFNQRCKSRTVVKVDSNSCRISNSKNALFTRAGRPRLRRSRKPYALSLYQLVHYAQLLTVWNRN